MEEKKENKSQLMTPTEAAEYMKLSEATLRRKRKLGEGPKYLSLAPKKYVYRQKDLDDWLDSLLIDPSEKVA